MELEECYNICREHNIKLKEMGYGWQQRKEFSKRCRRSCREKGRPTIFFYTDYIVSP